MERVMKNISYLLFLLYMLCPVVLPAKTVTHNGQLAVKGTQLVNQYGEPVVLRGVSLGWHNWWPRFYNASVVKELACKWNSTVVRAAMGIEPQGAYLTNPHEAKKLVFKVIEAAIKENIYVIVDWHSHDIQQEEAKLFFAEVANRYGKYPHIIYEIFNEPVLHSWEEVKQYSEEIIRAIRAVDADNIILVGSPHWSTDVDIVMTNPITISGNLMYSLHFYANGHREDLRQKAEAAMAGGVPIFVSECASTEPSGDGEVDKKEWELWVNWMEKNKISWVAWSLADKNESCSMLTPEASSKGKWKDKVIKESGLQTRYYIQLYNP